jgi:hypothetical protein
MCTYTAGRVSWLSRNVTSANMDPIAADCFTRIRSQIHARFPTADVPSVLALLLLQDGMEQFLELPMVYEDRLQGLLKLSVTSLGQWYQTILASTFLSHPIEPPLEMINDRFLSAPLSFTISNEHIIDIFGQMKWCLFGNLSRYLNFDLSSITYITRCRNLLSTHVLFQYISPTEGVLHILPGCIRPTVTGGFEKYSIDTRLPFEYTFNHVLHYEHYNYRHSQLKTQMSPVERILGHAHHPIGRSMGTFYRTAGGNVVLVSPSVRTLGYVLNAAELEQIDKIRCSFVDLAPGEDLCGTVVLPVMQGISNPDHRPSYLVVSDRDLLYWTQRDVPPVGVNLHIVSFSDLVSRVSWPDMHVLAIENAHKMSSLPHHVCRHLICFSTDVQGSMSHLMQLSGIRQLPFVPLEPERDICVFQERDSGVPYPIMIEPDPAVVRVHRQLSGEYSMPAVQDHLLRVCAGGSVTRMTTCVQVNGLIITDAVCSETPFGSPVDGCMVCLSSVMVDPIVLPCRHLVCKTCVHEIALRAQAPVPRCPCCRASIDRPTTRPTWTDDQHALTTIVSKRDAIGRYVRSFVETTGRLCIITGHPEIAQTYAAMLRTYSIHTCLYDGITSPNSDDRVVICSFGAYDRHVHTHCTDILVSDIDRDGLRGLTKVLHDRIEHVGVCLMRGGADEILFRRWYPAL